MNISDTEDHPMEFTTREAASLLRCSEGFLIRMRNQGVGPAYQKRWKRKGIFYLRGDLEIWKAGRRYLSTSEY